MTGSKAARWRFVIGRLFLFVLFFNGVASARDWGRDDIDFGAVRGFAEELSREPYQAVRREDLPEWVRNLNYDQYRSIVFNEHHTLWAGENLPFRTMFFHPGYIFQEPVMINEMTDTHRQRVRFSKEFFQYGHLTEHHGPLPPEVGFGGFKVLADLDGKDGYDELAVFQGASYWRALGKGQHYGISARGIAVNTGLEGVEEEFPAFREFWLKKPQPGAEKLTVFALLDGASMTGAYEFQIDPGDETVMDVKMVLFPRREIERLGIAPMSSMFWFGENSRRRFDDFRPEVHDSDGLTIRRGNGERIWRPVANDTGLLDFSFFGMDKCDGFGLLQRDRRFDSYEDSEADYHIRPSLWIEPTSDWGSGNVMLMEIPTNNEVADNTVAMWVPDRKVVKGEPLEFSYRQVWTMNGNPAQADAYVVGSRTGVLDWQKDMRTMVVEFAGESLKDEGGKLPEGLVEVVGDKTEQVKITDVNVEEMPGDRVRLVFKLTAEGGEGALVGAGPIELRAALKRGENYLTETWIYRIDP
ncbi:glucan biosynthesis protein [Luteolibacter sp. AS25]|uniref:glucan biosynthesis protein n=1 Tax=Luteolibacter sp. AS25 TaxID=3135776 RepID=UPI00398A5404